MADPENFRRPPQCQQSPHDHRVILPPPGDHARAGMLSFRHCRGSAFDRPYGCRKVRGRQMKRLADIHNGERDGRHSVSVRDCRSGRAATMPDQAALLHGCGRNHGCDEAVGCCIVIHRCGDAFQRSSDVFHRSACAIQHSSDASHRGARVVHRGSDAFHRSACAIQHNADASSPSACVIQHSSDASQHSACVVQHSSSASQHSACVFHLRSDVFHRSACAFDHSTDVLHHRTCASHHSADVSHLSRLAGSPDAIRELMRSNPGLHPGYVVSMTARSHPPGSGSHAGSPPPGMRSTVFR